MSVNTVYSVSECVLQNIFMIYKMIMFKTSPKSDITNRSASAQLCSVTPASWLGTALFGNYCNSFKTTVGYCKLELEYYF